jgi:hypothetical protein
MIKKMIVVTIVMVWTLTAVTYAADKYKNYELMIDGKTYDLNLNEKIEIKDRAGKILTIVLKKKPFNEFSDKFVSFQHKSDMSVSSQKLEEGIYQLMSATATGTIIMLQEYADMAPSLLVPMLLNELTKESIEYGYKMIKEEITRKVKSGKILKGVKATLRYKGEESYWEVLAYEKKDTGVIVMTHIDREFIKTDKELLDRFWSTLKFKF